MPIKRENRDRYPKEWKSIRSAILERARHRCEWCGAADGWPHPVTGSKVVLTIAHLDHQPENCDPGNLKALCQRDHNAYDRSHRLANRQATLAERRRQLQPDLPGLSSD